MCTRGVSRSPPQSLLATPQLIRQTITLNQSPSTSNSTMCCLPRFTHNTQQRRGEKRELSNPQQLSGPCYSIIMFDYNLISHFYRIFCGQSERRVEKRDFHRHKMCLGVFSGFSIIVVLPRPACRFVLILCGCLKEFIKYLKKILGDK